MVLQRLPKTAMAIALACSIGLHWAFFQSLAWVGMVISYSQEATIAEAFVKTFDGKHPCAICKEIAKGKQSEKKSEFPIELKKFECLVAQTRFVFTAPTHFLYLPNTELHLKSVLLTPPTPPPRRFLA